MQAEVGKFVGLMFLDRDIAHRAHLATTGPGSYAKHQALAGFYAGIVDLADRFAEAYQGFHEELIDVRLQASEDSLDRVMQTLRMHGGWIRTNRDKICQGNSTLLNIVDEILALYYSTNYKLKFLQ